MWTIVLLVALVILIYTVAGTIWRRLMPDYSCEPNWLSIIINLVDLFVSM